jgi:hypothetical protein
LAKRTAVDPDARWLALLERPAVRVEGTQLDVCDLVLLGVLTGAWVSFTDGVRRGLAASTEPGATTAEIRTAATAFRRARRLVSAAEFRAWLRDRELTVDALSAALSRRLSAERVDEETGFGRDEGELAAVLRVEAFISGVLETLAVEAANRLVAADRLGDRAPNHPAAADRVEVGLAAALRESAAGLSRFGKAELRARLESLVALDEALSQLRRELAQPDAIARCLAGHRFDWLRLRGEELAVALPGAAREARMLVHDDGLPLREVAGRAGVAVRARSLYLEDAPADVAAALAAALPGEVVGPWHEGARWRVLVLIEKTPPSADDDALLERAVDELLLDALEAHRAGRSERLCVL